MSRTPVAVLALAAAAALAACGQEPRQPPAGEPTRAEQTQFYEEVMPGTPAAGAQGQAAPAQQPGTPPATPQG